MGGNGRFCGKLGGKLPEITRFLLEHLFYRKILVKMVGLTVQGGENVEKRRQDKWDAEHMRTVGTKLTMAEYRCLKVYCTLRGETVYAVLGRLIRSWMDDPDH